MYVSAAVLEVETETGKNFEVTLDKEIAMFDIAPIVCAEILNPLGPLNSGPTNFIPLPNPKSPLANIINLSPSQDKPMPKASPKWTRIKRQVGSTEENIALNAALGKRIARLPYGDLKPSKHKIT